MSSMLPSSWYALYSYNMQKKRVCFLNVSVFAGHKDVNERKF